MAAPGVEHEHRARIERALSYIAANLDRPLSVAEVAKVAALSEFHFHRVFAAVMGEAVGAFITRKRLETSALMLAHHPFRSVTDIGLAVGYSSTANFSKAFSGYFGCRPTDVRDPSRRRAGKVGKLASKYGKGFSPAELHALPDAPASDTGEPRERRLREIERGLRFEDRPEMAVACLASPAGYDIAAVMRTWDELIARGRQLGICGAPVDAYGMAHDSPQLTAPELCRYHACIPLPEGATVASPLFRAVIPAGRYAVFHHRGPVEGVEQAYRDIYAIWFPSSSLAPDDFVSVDHYVNDAPRDGKVDMEILIKVRPRDREA